MHKKPVKILAMTLAVVTIFLFYHCSAPKKIGENTYKFKDQALKLTGHAEIYYQEAPDSAVLKYESVDVKYRIYVKVPIEDKLDWYEKLEDETISFEATKVTKKPFDDYYDVKKETIKIKHHEE